MKKIYTFLLICFCLNIVNAQINITQNDMPHAGDTARYTTAELNLLINYSATGANHTWDFSNLRAASQGLQQFIDVSSTNLVYAIAFANIPFFPNRSNVSSNTTEFPTSPLVPLTNPYNFYYRTSSLYKQTGFGAEIAGIPVPVAFNNHDIIYNLPINYGDQDTSNSDWNINVAGVGDLGYWQTRINNVDGWGTLITPHGSYNVLRVKTTREQRDTVALDTLVGFALDRPVVREYKWLANGEIIPVMQITTQEIFGIEVVSDIFFRDDFIKIETNALASLIFCAGMNVSVPYTKHGTFNPQGLFSAANVFTAQLSDSTGSFASPVNIGSVTSTQSGTINATIPPGTPAGMHYRIRVVSSSLPVEGTDNGTDIIIFNSVPVLNPLSASGTLTICSGNNVVLSTDVNSYFTYQWLGNGTAISGETSSTYTATAAGSYTVNVTNVCGSASSDTAIVTIQPAPTADITTSALFPCVGDTIELDGNVTDANSLQWQLNGTDIAGETNITLFTSVDGSYTLVATGQCGTETSNPYVILFNTAPAPATLTATANNACAGDSIFLNATTSNGNFQWQLNGTDILNEVTTSMYAFVSGDYTLVTSNLCGSSISDTITLNFISTPATPAFTAASVSACAGDSILLSATGVTGLGIQWQLNGTDIPGAVNSDLYVSVSGSYTLVVSNNCGSSTSIPTAIIINPLPAAPTINQTNDTTLHSTIAVNYQWFHNGTIINGAMSQDYHPTEGGNYTVVITDANGCTNVSSSFYFSMVGLNEINVSSIHIYPNPAHDELTIEWNQTQAPVMIEIYNLVGELIMAKENADHQQKINLDLNLLSRGIYMVHCTSSAGSFNYKLVKE